MPADNAEQRLARFIVQKKLATPQQVKEAMAAAAAHPQKPSLMQMLVARKLITKEQAAKVQAAVKAGAGGTAAQPKKAAPDPTGGLEFADDDDDVAPKRTAAEMLGGNVNTGAIGGAAGAGGLDFADDDNDDLGGLEIPDDDELSLDIPDDALSGAKTKKKKKKAGGGSRRAAAAGGSARQAKPKSKGKKGSEPEMLACMSCGSEAVVGTKRCPNCGAPMPAPRGVQRDRRPAPAWITPLLGLIVVGGLVFAGFQTGIIGGSGNTPRNTGSDGGTSKRGSGGGSQDTAPPHSADGVENGEQVRVRGSIVELKGSQFRIATSHGTEVLVNWAGRVGGWLGEYRQRPEDFADRPLEFVGQLYFRPGKEPVVNRASLSAEGFWVDDGSGVDFILDADAPEPRVEDGPSDEPEPGTDPTNPDQDTEPEELPPPSEWLAGFFAQIVELGPRTAADREDQERYREWRRLLRQMRDVAEAAYIPLAINWLTENPPPPLGPDDETEPEIDSEIWGALLESLARQRQRARFADELAGAMALGVKRYPAWTVQNLAGATSDPAAALAFVDFAMSEDDDSLPAGQQEAMRKARQAVVRQLADITGGDRVADVEDAMHKLTGAADPAVGQLAIEWLAKTDPLGQIPTLALWLTDEDEQRVTMAAEIFRSYASGDDNVKTAALDALRPLIVDREGTVHPPVLGAALAIDKAAVQTEMLAAMQKDRLGDDTDTADALKALLDQHHRSNLELAATILPDQKLADPCRVWALEVLRRDAENNGADGRQRYLETVLELLENAGDSLNPHPALKGFVSGREDLIETFEKFLDDHKREDGAELIERIAECNKDIGVEKALGYVAANDAPSRARARTLDWIAANGTADQLEDVLGKLASAERDGGPYLALAIRRHRLPFEVRELVEEDGGRTRDVEDMGVAKGIAPGRRTVRCAMQFSNDDQLIVAIMQREQFHVVQFDDGEAGDRVQVDRRALSMAWEKYEKALDTWENAPRGSRGDKPRELDGKRPGTSAVLYAWLADRKTAMLFNASGQVEQWDLGRQYSLTPWGTGENHLCVKLTDVAESIEDWPAGGVDPDDVATAPGSHMAAVRLRDSGDVVFIDMNRGSIRGRCHVGDFTTMRLTDDGTQALFLGGGRNAKIRVADVTRDKDARELPIKSPAGDHAYWGLRGRHIYAVVDGALHAFDVRDGKFDGGLPAALKVEEGWMLESAGEGRFLLEASGRRLVIREVGSGHKADLKAVLELPSGVEHIAVGENGRRVAIGLASKDIITYRLR